MHVKNQLVYDQVKSGRPLRLDLGAGENPRPGYFSVDLRDLPGVDIVADLEQPLAQLPEGSVATIYSHHLMEHLHDFPGLMSEIHRLLTADGRLEIVVPHWSNPYQYSDPDHKRFFGLYSFNYFTRPARQSWERKVPFYYRDSPFLVKSVRIEFYRTTIVDRVFGKVLERTINKSLMRQTFYERRVAAHFHARQLRAILVPDKDF